MASDDLLARFSSLIDRRVVLVGGKGGVGKTTVATAAALHLARSRPVVLFTTDPASNLHDLFGETEVPSLTIESLDAAALYARFLGEHLASFLEIGDRGTYLDREELRRLFELSMPGVDELMAWMRIGELAEERPDALVVVDTAPTGHTMRMLSASGHFSQLAAALDAMQEKHRALVYQFTRREVRDAIDTFIEEFEARAARRRELLTDPARAAFVPVTLAEPLVIEQTLRLIGEVAIDVPFVVLNRAHGDDRMVSHRFDPRPVVRAVRACAPLDTIERLRAWSEGEDFLGLPHPDGGVAAMPERKLDVAVPLLFFAGKGGVGKTSCSASVALQRAARDPSRRYVVLSVDPAHSLRDLFAEIEPPPNLSVETIDTRAKWQRFRDSLGDEIAGAFDALAPRGVSLSHDSEAMQRLIEIAPPGADELFAIIRLADLIADDAIDGVIVDTAPTGHFLRLLELPRAAGEWVHEFMRLLLRYRDLIPAGSLGEELVRASRALRQLDAALRSERAAVVVVTRPERIVLAETERLVSALRERGIDVNAVIANYVTPEGGDSCDASIRKHELAALHTLDAPIIIERRPTPPRTVAELANLVPTAD